MTKKQLSYTQAITEIQQIVHSIESGEPDVDELSDKLKKAIELIKMCREKLHTTEKEIQELVDSDDE